MPRVKLREQATYDFKTELELTSAEINDAGHLSFERVLSLARLAWQALFAELGVRDTDLGDGVTGIIVSDLVVNYRGEAFEGDRIVIGVCRFEVSDSTFRLAMRLRVTGSERLVALIELGIVAFEYGAHVKATFPGEMVTRLREMAG